MSQLAKGKSRDPPPTLFPYPSRTASHVSFPGQGPSSSGGPSQPSAFTTASPTPLPPPALTTSPATTSNTANPTGGGGGGGGGLAINLPLPRPLSLNRDSTRATDRTDALWAEMQATLEAVELSAAGSTAGPRVFGPDHEKKLDALRAAQIALAQAWARSEADEAIETLGLGAGGATDGPAGGVSDGVGPGAGTGAGGAGRSGGAGGQEKSGATKVPEETEVDILLARKRREANDRYFQRVNQGVLDVVAKLEEVATSMWAVEQESKELWGDETESVPGSAKPQV
ncbi:hypothetical protein BT67DRAFT_405363 [Trichocladium antarcticum]|uniref:Uncharacterized protein n=1 Tax=Trichocladium antarcticum TaxID=1450529 RepID=A0AAN6UIC6_9PEZI|nr:hypothetical protein BT67DRAFT_405363 [Trichocladium antarcticum]